MACDPDFGQVALLLHCDGTNGSPLFTDSSANNLTVTAVGITVDTSDPQFGTGAMNLGPRTTGHYCTIPAGTGSPLDLTTGDFTIEFSFNPSVTTPAGSLFMGDDTVSLPAWQILWDGSAQRIEFIVKTATANPGAFGATITVVPGTYYAIACVKQANILTVYTNGIAGTPQTWSGSPDLIAGAGAMQIGGESSGLGDANFPGELDEIRVSLFARYTSNYTPATSAFGGTCSITVPNVTGQALATAEAELVAAVGLVIGSVTQTSGPSNQ